jgi:hypothetical protein
VSGQRLMAGALVRSLQLDRIEVVLRQYAV